jgi:hypothetical protein
VATGVFYKGIGKMRFASDRVMVALVVELIRLSKNGRRGSARGVSIYTGRAARLAPKRATAGAESAVLLGSLAEKMGGLL